jgi:hypothetical protein
VAGSLIAGKNTNNVFVENGRLHGKSIISAVLARGHGSSVDSVRKFQ